MSTLHLRKLGPFLLLLVFSGELVGLYIVLLG
jgi:hypothetical protein